MGCAASSPSTQTATSSSSQRRHPSVDPAAAREISVGDLRRDNSSVASNGATVDTTSTPNHSTATITSTISSAHAKRFRSLLRDMDRFAASLDDDVADFHTEPSGDPLTLPRPPSLHEIASAKSLNTTNNTITNSTCTTSRGDECLVIDLDCGDHHDAVYGDHVLSGTLDDSCEQQQKSSVTASTQQVPHATEEPVTAAEELELSSSLIIPRIDSDCMPATPVQRIVSFNMDALPAEELSKSHSECLATPIGRSLGEKGARSLSGSRSPRDHRLHPAGGISGDLTHGI